MKNRFWLFKRGNVFYVEDSLTRKQESLQTKDLKEAEKIRDAKNEATRHPVASLAIGKAYLAAYDPKLTHRRWSDVMEKFLETGLPSTVERKKRAVRSRPFRILSEKKLVETTAEDFFQVLSSGKVSANHFLKCLQNLATGLNWLPLPIIPLRLWPTAKTKEKRGITALEHERVVDAEKNEERRHFYELLWEVGASQTDTALLTSENIDWESKTLRYQRHKTGAWAKIRIGPRLERLLKSLPSQGLLFPSIGKTKDKDRAAEFCRRCRLLGISGVSLHSYRYAWAERAKVAGYPERHAQNALGHNSRAVHAAYSKGGIAVCPSLEEFEATASPVDLAPKWENLRVGG